MEERNRPVCERVNGTEKRGKGSSFNNRRWSKEGTEREATKEQIIKEEIKKVDNEQRNIK